MSSVPVTSPTEAEVQSVSGCSPVPARGATRAPAPLRYIDCGTIEQRREGSGADNRGTCTGSYRLFVTVPADELDDLLGAFRGR